MDLISIKNKFYSLRYSTRVITLFLLVGAFLFYWYEIRPGEVRKECVNVARQFPDISAQVGAYNRCMLDHGIPHGTLASIL